MVTVLWERRIKGSRINFREREEQMSKYFKKRKLVSHPKCRQICYSRETIKWTLVYTQEFNNKTHTGCRIVVSEGTTGSFWMSSPGFQNGASHNTGVPKKVWASRPKSWVPPPLTHYFTQRKVSVALVLGFWFYEWRNWGPERFSDSLKVTQLIHHRGEPETRFLTSGLEFFP